MRDSQAGVFVLPVGSQSGFPSRDSVGIFPSRVGPSRDFAPVGISQSGLSRVSGIPSRDSGIPSRVSGIPSRDSVGSDAQSGIPSRDSVGFQAPPVGTQSGIPSRDVAPVGTQSGRGPSREFPVGIFPQPGFLRPYGLLPPRASSLPALAPAAAAGSRRGAMAHYYPDCPKIRFSKRGSARTGARAGTRIGVTRTFGHAEPLGTRNLWGRGPLGARTFGDADRRKA